jgi:hypothetical protein
MLNNESKQLSSKLGRGLVIAWLASCMATSSLAGLTIASPQPDSTVHDNNGEVTVHVDLTDGETLAGGVRVRILLNGRAAADADGTRVALTGVSRGEHELQAQLLAADGSVLASSTPVRFQMWQASRRFPARQ